MDNFRFAERTGWELNENALTQTFRTLKDEGAPVLDLTESNPTNCRLKMPARKILKAFNRKENLLYRPEARGLLEARQALSAYFQEQGLNADPAQIFLTASTSEAYAYLFRLLADPGDTVLFPQPSYPLFSFLGELNDVRLKFYPLRYADGWSVNFAELTERIEPSTKAICLVNPNNPTGSYVKPEELKELVRICREHGLVLICDEVFWAFSLDGENHLSLLNCREVPVCVLGGLSKTLGLPQMKLSWLVLGGPSEWQRTAGRRLEVIADTYLSVNTPVQQALKDWLKLSREITGNIRERIQANARFVQKEMQNVTACRLLPAEGGWYAVLKMPAVRSEEEWVLKLLTKYHVLAHPGYFYDFVEEPYLVLSLLPEPEVFQEGLRRILSRAEQQYVNA